MAYCTDCGFQLSESALYCSKCGAARKKERFSKGVCPNCGHALVDGMVFCDKCGTKAVSSKGGSPPPEYKAPDRAEREEANAVPAAKTTASAASTKQLSTLCAFCLLCFLPIGIYGYICLSKAHKAATRAEADEAIKKGTVACKRALIAVGSLLLIILIYSVIL